MGNLKFIQDIKNLDTAMATIVTQTSLLNTSEEILPVDFALFEPSIASNEWVTDATGKVLNINTTQFLALFYDSFVGVKSDEMVVTKTSLGKDQSGLYDLYEYDFKPKNYTKTILLTSGMHSYELSASFGLAHFIKHLMVFPYEHDGFKYLRENVRIKVIPVVNPWGFNQSPKKYGNINGVNFNRNFDSVGSKWADYPLTLPADNEWNYKGTAPFSEAESQILRDWATTNRTSEFWIDCHTGLGLTPIENYIVYLTQDTIVPKIKTALTKLENRIKTKYGKLAPISQEDTDWSSDIRSYWAIETLGMSNMTIEQTPNNALWGTDLNNESGDITEFEATISAYVFTFLSPAFSNTNSFDYKIKDLENRTIILESGSIITPIDTVIVADTFDRANNASLGSTEVGNKVWTNVNGTFGIVSNKAINLTETGDTSKNYIDIGVSNFDVSVDITWFAYAGLQLRYSDAINNILLRLNATSLKLMTLVNDVETFSSEYIFSPVASTTYNLRVIAKGTSIIVCVNGVEVMNITESNFLTNTKFGLITFVDTSSTFDNLVIKTVDSIVYAPIAIATPATTGVMTITMTSKIKTITPTGACTFNAIGGEVGQTCTFIITTTGTTTRVLTWGTNFKTIGTLSTGTVSGKRFTVSFIYDGTYWIETGRTIAM